MGLKRDLINAVYMGKRRLMRSLRNRRTQKVMYVSYQLYSVARVVRNPFVLLEYVNVYNVLRLL
tara:strand:+ start:508 stop:699 length:192 start_codon:yes stop_codon:yes gene_type:complete